MAIALDPYAGSNRFWYSKGMVMLSLQWMLLLIVFASPAEPSRTQCVPITDSVAQTRPKPFVSARISEMVVAPLDEAVREADLIIVGMLTQPRAYLSEDKCTLFTDFTIVPANIVAGALPKRDRPGPASIVVRSWGGATTVDGVPVKIYDENFKTLSPGQSYLLLLKLNESIGKYEIYGHGSYALELKADGRLDGVVKSKGLMDTAVDGARLDDAVRTLNRKRPR